MMRPTIGILALLALASCPAQSVNIVQMTVGDSTLVQTYGRNYAVLNIKDRSYVAPLKLISVTLNGDRIVEIQPDSSRVFKSMESVSVGERNELINLINRIKQQFEPPVSAGESTKYKLEVESIADLDSPNPSDHYEDEKWIISNWGTSLQQDSFELLDRFVEVIDESVSVSGNDLARDGPIVRYLFISNFVLEINWDGEIDVKALDDIHGEKGDMLRRLHMEIGRTRLLRRGENSFSSLKLSIGQLQEQMEKELKKARDSFRSQSESGQHVRHENPMMDLQRQEQLIRDNYNRNYDRITQEFNSRMIREAGASRSNQQF